ncbi:hypothetical protein BGZ76_005987 [Entomortierella beljakovae]|nr:hypothetical protein BGZ76_005987 [Entomortierella beljakovae]
MDKEVVHEKENQNIPQSAPIALSNIGFPSDGSQDQESNTLYQMSPSEVKIGEILHGQEDIDDEKPFGWVVVVAAFCVQAVVIGTINGYGVYQDRYEMHEYSTSSSSQLSLIGTLNVVGMDLTGLITGQVADHFGYRISAFVGGLVMTASLVATSFSTKVWQLYIFQGILYGIGASLTFFPSLSLPSQWFKRRRGFATGIVVAGGGVGGLILSPLITALFESIGYRWTVRVVALLHLAITVPASMLFKSRVESGRDRSRRLKLEKIENEKSIAAAAVAEERGNQSSVRTISNEELFTLPKPTEKKARAMDFSALKDKNLAILILVGFFSANGYFIPFYFFPTYARTHGMSVSTASLLIGVLNGSSALGRVTMGLASDYIGDVNTLLISAFVASLSIFIAWTLAGMSTAIMAIFCVTFGFFSGSFVAIIPTVAAHICGIGRLASVTGIVYAGIAIGTLVGSPVGGALLDLSNGSNYLPTQLYGGVAFMVGAALTMALKLKMNPKFFGRV